MTTYTKTDLFKFWYTGFMQALVVVYVLQAAYQDAIGLEAYILHVRKSWVDVNVLLWVVVSIVWLGSIITTLYRMRARQKQVTFCEDIVVPQLNKLSKKEEVVFDINAAKKTPAS